MQVLKLTAICDQPSSRSTTLRSFMFDNGVTCVKAAKMIPAVDGKSLIYSQTAPNSRVLLQQGQLGCWWWKLLSKNSLR